MRDFTNKRVRIFEQRRTRKLEQPMFDPEGSVAAVAYHADGYSFQLEGAPDVVSELSSVLRPNATVSVNEMGVGVVEETHFKSGGWDSFDELEVVVKCYREVSDLPSDGFTQVRIRAVEYKEVGKGFSRDEEPAPEPRKLSRKILLRKRKW